MEQIIQETYIDETAARGFLNDCYKDIDLLPNVPEVLSRQIVSAILNVSIPTVDRMLQDRQVSLTKKSIQTYLFENMLVNRPLIWNDENKTQTGKELKIRQVKEQHPQIMSLFSENDLIQQEK